MERFHEAINDGNTRIVRRMLKENPALVDDATPNDFTPLMLAVMTSERTSALVKALIEAGANVRAKTPEDYTALHCSIDVNGPTSHGRTAKEIIRLLVEAGADLEVRNHYGWTPLMQAVLEGSAIQVKELLSAGANPNVMFPGHTEPRCLRGDTVLMLALSDEVKLRLLIKAGADVHARGEHGQTVFEHAKELLAQSSRDAFRAKISRGVAILERAGK